MNTTARFIKNGSDWFIALPKEDFQEGLEVSITKRNGTTANVRIDDWMEEDGDEYWCCFTNLDPKPQKKTSSRRAPRRSNRRMTKQCIACGETEMISNGHCLECGCAV